MKNKKNSLKARVVHLVTLFTVLFVAVFICYAQSRLFSSIRAVKSIEYDFPTNQALVDKNQITVGTYNIAHARGGNIDTSNWTGRSRKEIIQHLNMIGDQIRKAGVDILVLNEVDFETTWSKGIDMTRIIAKRADFKYCVQQRNMDVVFPFLKYRFGNAVLSKYPLLDSRMVYFEAMSKPERLFVGNHDGLLVKADTPLGEVRIFAVHLEYRVEDVRVEASKLIRSIALEEDCPLIAMGDFNSAPQGAIGHKISSTKENAVDILLKSGLFSYDNGIDLKKYLTFPAKSPERAIDWILTTEELEQSETQVINSECSDHLMVVTEISTKRDIDPTGL